MSEVRSSFWKERSDLTIAGIKLRFVEIHPSSRIRVDSEPRNDLAVPQHAADIFGRRLPQKASSGGSVSDSAAQIDILGAKRRNAEAAGNAQVLNEEIVRIVILRIGSFLQVSKQPFRRRLIHRQQLAREIALRELFREAERQVHDQQFVDIVQP